MKLHQLLPLQLFILLPLQHAHAVFVPGTDLSIDVDDDVKGHYFTYPDVSGNRIIKPAAQGTFPNDLQMYDLYLPSEVRWVVATHHKAIGYRFVVTTADDKAYNIAPSTVDGRPAMYEEIDDYQASGDQPPLVKHVGNTQTPRIVTLPAEANQSPLSHPIPCGDGSYAFIDTIGDVILWSVTRNKKLGHLPGVSALVDARLVRADDSAELPLLAFYTGITEYKSDCSLGECAAATHLMIIRVNHKEGQIEITADVALPDGDVFQGNAPMFLPDDSVVATVSNENIGSLLVRYDYQGNRISSTPFNGWSGWTHPLFYNSFGPVGYEAPLMVDVRNPDTTGLVQWYDMTSEPYWTLNAKAVGYRTHTDGSRVLDTAVSGDFNGDGMNEAVLPTAERNSIAGVQVTFDDELAVVAEEVWRLKLPGEMTSNLAAVGNSEGGRGIALGVASGKTFRMFLPVLSEPTAPQQTKTTDSPTSEPTDEPNAGIGFLTTDAPTVESETDAPTAETDAPTDEAPRWTWPPTRKPTFPFRLKPTAKPTKLKTDEPTGEPTDEPYVGPTYAPTDEPTNEPVPVPVRNPTLPPAFQIAPTPDEKAAEMAIEAEMETQMEEMINQLESKEAADERKSTAIAGTVSALCVVAVGILAFVIGKRYSSRKTMDTAADNKGDVSASTLDAAPGDASHDLDMDEEDGNDMVNVQLDRSII